ncbi:MAG: ATP-binding cassette domain-containing protein [Pseudomonadota bacterium]
MRFVLKDVVYERRAAKRTLYRLTIRDLTISGPGVVAIVGPSGSGKSTLLNLLGGLDAPLSGTIRVTRESDPDTGKDPEDFGAGQVGRVFQQGHLLRTATISANVATSCVAAGSDTDRHRLADALQKFGLDERHLDQRAWQLSGGQGQRASIARAIVADPHIVFADEPTSGADPATAEDVMGSLRSWAKEEGKDRTILWVTHDYDLACRFADSVVVLTYHRDADIATAGIIENETAPRPVPDDAATLRNWVDRSSTRTNGPVADDVTPVAADEHAPVPNEAALSRLIAVADIFGKTSAADTFRTFGHLTSIGVTPSGWFRTLKGLFRGFSQTSLLARQVLAGFLVFGVLAAWAFQRDLSNHDLNDPAFCHVVVGGTPRTEMELMPAFVAALGSRPWRTDQSAGDVARAGAAADNAAIPLFDDLETANPALGCNSAIGAWPRKTDKLNLAMPGADGTCEPPGLSRSAFVEVKFLATHRNEPVLSALPLVAGTAADIGGAFSSQPQAGRRLGIVLSEKIAREEFRLDADAMMETGRLCVDLRGDIRLVRLLGVSNRRLADEDQFYDALLPLEAVERRIGPFRSYNTAALYFDSSEIDRLAGFLSPAEDAPDGVRLKFDPTPLDQLRDAIALNAKLGVMFLAATLFVIVVNTFNLYATYSGFIQENSQSMAMQLAIGLPNKFVREVLGWHVGLIWALAMMIYIPAALMFTWVARTALDIEILLWPDTFVLIAVVALATVTTSYIAMWLSIIFWKRETKGRIADVLQSGS